MEVLKIAIALIVAFILLVGTGVIALDTDTYISCGGDNELIVGCLDDEENFFISELLTEPTITPTPEPSGGGGTTTQIEEVDKVLCELTHIEILEFGQTDYSRIDEIQDNYKKLQEREVSWNLVRTYMDRWQSLCSDIMNRTLEEEYVCDEIFNFVTINDYDFNILKLNQLKEDLQPKIDISIGLLQYYMREYHDLCYNEGYSEKLEKDLPLAIIGGESDANQVMWLLIFIGIMLLFVILLYINKKTKFIINLMERKWEKENRDKVRGYWRKANAKKSFHNILFGFFVFYPYV